MAKRIKSELKTELKSETSAAFNPNLVIRAYYQPPFRSRTFEGFWRSWQVVLITVKDEIVVPQESEGGCIEFMRSIGLKFISECKIPNKV